MLVESPTREPARNHQYFLLRGRTEGRPTDIDDPARILANSTIGFPNGDAKVYKVFHIRISLTSFGEARRNRKNITILLDTDRAELTHLGAFAFRAGVL